MRQPWGSQHHRLLHAGSRSLQQSRPQNGDAFWIFLGNNGNIYRNSHGCAQFTVNWAPHWMSFRECIIFYNPVTLVMKVRGLNRVRFGSCWAPSPRRWDWKIRCPRLHLQVERLEQKLQHVQTISNVSESLLQISKIWAGAWREALIFIFFSKINDIRSMPRWSGHQVIHTNLGEVGPTWPT